jgi:hypothetical protein
MDFFIKTEEILKCRDALDEFSAMVKKEYKKQIKNPLLKPVKKTLTGVEEIIEPMVVTMKDGVILSVFTPIPKIFEKTRMKVKLIKNIEGFLVEKGVKFEVINLVQY